MNGIPPFHGERVELGEPQWAAMRMCTLGQIGAVAHWFYLHPDNPRWAVSACGAAYADAALFHVGAVELCPRCAVRHRPPHRTMPQAFRRWFTFTAPHEPRRGQSA
ncbi:MAG: hypothetical protein BGP16_05485 [Sphingobium sp. 66-54]|nr:MAG: hypothetical protein BGP16_05485 [Sphingobium sp. 66-54]